MPERLRAVAYDQGFDQQLQSLGGAAPNGPGRIDDVVDGVEWAVASRDDRFPQIPGTNLHVVKTEAAPPSVPPLRFFVTYSDDDQTVTMRWVEIEPDEDEYDGEPF